jgi:APA family basic amino acid/polyamine antiporter
MGVSAALVPVLFSYGGWQHALWIAGEVRKPQRDVPFAILTGTIVVIIVYLLANWAYLKLLGFSQVSESKALAADAVAVVWPTVGKRVVAGAVALSAFGVLNAQFLTGPRLVYRMALEGQFFKPFMWVSPRFATPVPAILLLGAVPLVLLLTAGPNGADKILTGAVLIDGIFFALTALALLVLRRKQPDAPRSVRVPGYPFVPLLFFVGEIAVVIGAFTDPKVRSAAGIGLIWVAGAAVCYALFFRKGKNRQGNT